MKYRIAGEALFLVGITATIVSALNGFPWEFAAATTVIALTGLLLTFPSLYERR